MQTWSEDIASRRSSEVVSFLWNFVNTSNNISTRKHFVVWSNSNAGQNKNFQMICFHQLVKLKSIFNVIDYKCAVHTYLDSDRDFERIEKVLRKHGSIFDPNLYRKILKEANTKNSTVINIFIDMYL